MDNPKLLIIEDDELIRIQLSWALSQEYSLFFASDRPSALEVFKKENPFLILLDLGLPPCPEEVKEGFLILREILDRDALTKVIIITGHEERDNALEAIGQGAYDFFCKPIQIEDLKVFLRKANYVYEIEREYHEGKEKHLKEESFEGMLGKSHAMQEVFSTIKRVSKSNVPILIIGESGTGKELVAHAIHRDSLRREGPFVAINCGAIPETLIESELFGHEKGAFTGAHIQRVGRFEKAQGGTLFLDEIGDLSLPLQVKLLRFLQEQKIERVGGRIEIALDVRIMAATNKDLIQILREGKFREDLYYRLAVIIIPLPPLRERKEDIVILSHAFLQIYAHKNHKNLHGFTPQAIHAVENYYWPGNIRELENRIRRAVIMSDGKRLTPKDLELISPHEGSEVGGFQEFREAAEADFIRSRLINNNWKITQTAAKLKISRSALYEMMKKFHIEKWRNGKKL